MRPGRESRHGKRLCVARRHEDRDLTAAEMAERTTSCRASLAGVCTCPIWADDTSPGDCANPAGYLRRPVDSPAGHSPPERSFWDDFCPAYYTDECAGCRIYDIFC